MQLSTQEKRGAGVPGKRLQGDILSDHSSTPIWMERACQSLGGIFFSGEPFFFRNRDTTKSNRLLRYGWIKSVP